MNKQKVGYLYNGIWFNHKKEWSSITCCNRNEPENITLGKISQSQEDHISYDSIKIKVLVTQFSSVQLLSRVWLCNPMDCSTPGFPVHHQFPEFTEIQVHWVCQWCHPTISSSVIPFSLSRVQFFVPGSSVHGISQAKRLERVAISFSRGSSWPRGQTQVFPYCRQILYSLSQSKQANSQREKASFQGLGGGRNIEWLLQFPFLRWNVLVRKRLW